VLEAWLKKPAWPLTEDLFVELVADVVVLEAIPFLSSSSSLSF
jgi:hypothetical protein